MDINASATLPGVVKRVVKAPSRNVPGKAQIAVAGSDYVPNEILIDNTLTTNRGENVQLEPGAKVEVTIEEKMEPIRFGRW